MKKTASLILILFLVYSLGAAVVSVGCEMGPNYNMIIAGKGYRDYRYEGKFNLTARAPVVIEFTPSIGLQTGVVYIEREYGYRRSAVNKSLSAISTEPYYFDTIDYEFHNQFLDFPLALRYTYTFGESGWSVYGTLGGFAGFWIDSKRAGAGLNVDLEPQMDAVSDELDLDYFNRFDAGVEAAVGVKWQFSKKVDAHVSLGYALSLTDMNKAQEHGSYPVHNSTLSLTGGVMWGINR